MKKEEKTEVKEVKKELKKFNFTTEGIIIEAASKEEAVKKYESQKKQSR